MPTYPFQLLNQEQTDAETIKKMLLNRPQTEMDRTFESDARRFVPGEPLETAMNTAIAVGEPLLITGEPGTGKTQAAYYAAYKLGLEPVIHFQVKSDSVARDLLYHFDTVRYFYDANMQHLQAGENGKSSALEKETYVEPRPLWEAFNLGKERGTPAVLLIDEIDKAPRDFPNDLLHELDKMEFKVPEIDETIAAPRNLAPIVFITSNSERRLPEPFLRRCVYHHIRFDDQLIHQAVNSRRDEYHALSDSFLEMAIKRFLALRGEHSLRKPPATGELLVWLRVLALAIDIMPERLEKDLSQLPYLGVLLKDHQDQEEL